MRFFDPAKWERVRSCGKRRFVRRFVWAYFFPAGLLIVLFDLWSFWRLQVTTSLPVSVLWPAFWGALFFIFIAFPLVGAGCALLAWHTSEWLYLRRRVIPS